MDGAISESLYVYIEQGLHSFSTRTNKETINILEIGFDLRIDTNIWSKTTYKIFYNLLGRNGVMVTYASTRLLKDLLLKANFHIQVLPIAIKKREMIKSYKILICGR